MKKRIALLGSTGSIGRQALEVVDAHPDMFEVTVLTAFNNAELLILQAGHFLPQVVIIGNKDKYNEVKEALGSLPVDVYCGMDAITRAVESDSVDMVLTAMVGFAGLHPTIRAVESGKDIALANKETMVVAGELIRKLAIKNNIRIIPVDSEHSAIFQCLAGEDISTVEKIILTASGGPFLDKSIEYIRAATREQALKHPRWNMGRKITIDSASMMNKGLEVIEARWLFDVDVTRIEVVIHPESIIHSMVQFTDGSMKAQLGVPDMRIPIQYALSYPHRIRSEFPRLDLLNDLNLTFHPPDIKKFRNLAISYEVLRKGGNWPCIMNAANEVAVNAFLHGRIGFLEMSDLIEKVLMRSNYLKDPSLEDYHNSDREARIIATEITG